MPERTTACWTLRRTAAPGALADPVPEELLAAAATVGLFLERLRLSPDLPEIAVVESDGGAEE